MKTRDKSESRELLHAGWSHALPVGTNTFSAPCWHRWVRSSMRMCQRHQSQETSHQKPSAWRITELLEGGEKNKEKHKGDASGTAVTISAIKTGNGCSRNILLDTRGMNGHDRSTNINEKKKKKENTGRDQNSTPFPHLLAYIHIYTYGYVHIYMYIYRDWPPRT